MEMHEHILVYKCVFIFMYMHVGGAMHGKAIAGFLHFSSLPAIRFWFSLALVQMDHSIHEFPRIIAAAFNKKAKLKEKKTKCSHVKLSQW